MDRFEQAAVLTELIDQMRGRGSWAGETHVQKATYFLQELLGVPMDFEFILYKHGPFSFDARDTLSTMRADQLVEIDVQPYPYGPRLTSTDHGREFKSTYHTLLDSYRPQIKFVTERLGDRRVTELERLATALYIRIKNSGLSVEERAREVNRLKPHVDVTDAVNAVKFVDGLAKEVAALQ